MTDCVKHSSYLRGGRGHLNTFTDGEPIPPGQSHDFVVIMVSGKVGDGIVQGEDRGDGLSEVEIDQAGPLTACAVLSQ